MFRLSNQWTPEGLVTYAPAEEGGSPSPPPSPSPDGGATSPASSPGLPSPTGGLKDADNVDNQNSFDDIFDGIDGLELDSPPPVKETRAPAVTPAPVSPQPTEASQTAQPLSTAPVATPAAAPPSASPVPQEVQPTATPPAQPDGAQGTQPSGPPTLESALEGMQRDAGPLVDALASQMFSLDSQTVEALQTDAVSAIPKLLARTFLLAHASALKAMQEFVPQQIDQRTQGHRAADSAQQEFFTAYPGLRNEAYASDIINAIQVIRARTPNIPRSQVIRQVGMMVSALHGLPTVAGGNGAPRPTAAPPPFVPHVGGGVTSTPSAQDENPFSGLGFEFDN